MLNNNKVYRVFNESTCEYFGVSEKWFDGINLDNLESLKYSSLCGKLEVSYKNGDVLIYNNIHGTWGFPTKLV